MTPSSGCSNFTDRIYRFRHPSARYVFRFQQHDKVLRMNQITVVSGNSSTRFIYSNRTIISTSSGKGSRHQADGSDGVWINTRMRSMYNITHREAADEVVARYFEVFVTTPAVSPRVMCNIRTRPRERFARRREQYRRFRDRLIIHLGILRKFGAGHVPVTLALIVTSKRLTDVDKVVCFIV